MCWQYVSTRGRSVPRRREIHDGDVGTLSSVTVALLPGLRARAIRLAYLGFCHGVAAVPKDRSDGRAVASGMGESYWPWRERLLPISADGA